jgi:hypothetical protein
MPVISSTVPFPLVQAATASDTSHNILTDGAKLWLVSRMRLFWTGSGNKYQLIPFYFVM